MTDYKKQSAWLQKINKDFWRNPNRMLALKVVIPVFVQSIPFLLFNNITAGITMSLGTVAAALSESDDHPKGRLKALTITIIGFTITTISVSLLKPFPLIFGIGFILSTIIFILIGGISERYRAISYGAILIGIYAMLVYHESSSWYLQPLLLCSGALIYGITSLLLLFRKPWRLLDEQLSSGFKMLSEYLDEKARSFANTQNHSKPNNKLSILNIKVVAALEKCKEVINIYNKEVDSNKLLPYLQRFMLLQSLHERAASSHEQYETLKEKIEYKELLEGFSELLHQLSHATRLLADNLLTNTTYSHPISIDWIISSLQYEIDKLPPHDKQLLELLLYNLMRSHQSLKKIYNIKESTSIPKLGVDNRGTWERIKEQLDFTHPRLRYAIRLSSCFLIAYTLTILFNLENGEWIILTSLFVSQPTYSETRKRLFQRIYGTMTGVIAGILLTQLTSSSGQLILILVSIYFFFYFLRTQYSYAVIFITIYVLASNSFNGETEVHILAPRLIDTIIGASLSFLAIRFLWPNWQYKQIPRLISNALTTNAKYLKEINTQLLHNNSDDYNYRLARRLAHKADNALTLAWQSMQIEPQKKQRLIQKAFTLTFLNHALLSHLSALGATNKNFKNKADDYLFIMNRITDSLFEAANTIELKQSKTTQNSLRPLLLELKEKTDKESNIEKKQHLRLLYNIAAVTNKLLKESNGIQSPPKHAHPQI